MTTDRDHPDWPDAAAREEQSPEIARRREEQVRGQLSRSLHSLNHNIRMLGGEVLVSEDAGLAMETHDLAIAVSNTSHRLRILTELA